MPTFPRSPLTASLFCFALCAPMAVSADLEVTFVEGAPKDRFVVVNSGTCALSGGVIEVDLSGSAAGLIFDVTASGAGVEVFQPVDVVAGAEALAAVPQVKDGDQSVRLSVKALPVGGTISFTGDVDDTKGTRAITVSRSEIAGAVVRYNGVTGAFDNSAKAQVATPACQA